VSDDQTEDTYPNAGRASGYTDDDSKPVGENIINRVTELMLGPQTKMLELAESQAKLTAQLNDAITRINDTGKMQDQQYHYMAGEFKALYAKEDKRHEVYDKVLAKTESDTLAAITSVALRLDEITSYVQQSVTIGRESKEIALRSEKTAIESLAIAKTNADQVIEVKRDVGALKKGQSTLSTRIADVQKQQEEIQQQQLVILEKQEAGETERAELARKLDTYIGAEHAELVRQVAELQAWKLSLERGA
jgi:hypothetical protein